MLRHTVWFWVVLHGPRSWTQWCCSLPTWVILWLIFIDESVSMWKTEVVQSVAKICKIFRSAESSREENEWQWQTENVCWLLAWLPQFKWEFYSQKKFRNQGLGIGLLNLTNFSLGFFELQHSLWQSLLSVKEEALTKFQNIISLQK